MHNSCNMAIHDLPDVYALSPWACGPRASGIHIRQIPHGHVATITCGFDEFYNVEIWQIFLFKILHCCNITVD